MNAEQVKTYPDIVERLRSGYIPQTMAEAADEIERLRLELAESARNVISQMAVEDELRSLIIAWADAYDAFAKHLGPRRDERNFGAIARLTADVDEATDELRKAVGQ